MAYAIFTPGLVPTPETEELVVPGQKTCKAAIAIDGGRLTRVTKVCKVCVCVCVGEYVRLFLGA